MPGWDMGNDLPEQDDVQFERNVSECDRWGCPGAYLYSYAVNQEQAKKRSGAHPAADGGKEAAVPGMPGCGGCVPERLDQGGADGDRLYHPGACGGGGILRHAMPTRTGWKTV